MVEEERFADVFDFGDCAFEVEGFGEDDLEDLAGHMCQSKVGRLGGAEIYLLDVDAMAGTAEDEAGTHGFCKAASLPDGQLGYYCH